LFGPKGNPGANWQEMPDKAWPCHTRVSRVHSTTGRGRVEDGGRPTWGQHLGPGLKQW